MALAVLGVGVAALIQLFSVSLRTTKKAEDYTKGMMHARALVEEAYSMDQLRPGLEHFDLGEGYTGEVSISQAVKEEGVTLYEIRAKVSWPPSGSAELAVNRAVYEEEDQED